MKDWAKIDTSGKTQKVTIIGGSIIFGATSILLMVLLALMAA